jgi:hypothetical protein
MTHERDLDRLLDTWFADGPRETPDRVLEDVTARIHRQPQRPAWRIALRETPMNAYLKPLAAVAAVIAIAVLGLYLVQEPSGVAGPAPTASPTLAPSASPAPPPSPTPVLSPSPIAITCDDGTTTTCAGRLAPGTHTSSAFQPALTFTAEDEWTNTFDIARAYNLKPVPHVFDTQVLSQLAIPEQNADCSPAAKPGVGNTVDDWVEFVTTHPGLTVSRSVPVTIGGNEGQQIQFRVADDWTERCPDSIGPAVVVFTDSGTPPQRSVWFDDHRVTLWLLDVDGTTIAIHVDSGPSLNANDEAVRAFQPVLESMSFAPAP